MLHTAAESKQFTFHEGKVIPHQIRVNLKATAHMACLNVIATKSVIKDEYASLRSEGSKYGIDM